VRHQRRDLLLAALALALGGGCGAALTACGSSDEDEARAVVGEFRRALDADDGERACRLLTARARAKLNNCEQAVAGTEPGDSDAPLTVDGDRATLGSSDGGARVTLLKGAGSWRIDTLPSPANAGRADSPVDAAFYARCWRDAGARIASSARDIAFAAADRPVVALRGDHVSAKGGDWRIFYTLPRNGEDPGLARIIRDPGAAAVVAYVEDARANSGIVERARACEAPG
jgi:hypothetical protein